MPKISNFLARPEGSSTTSKCRRMYGAMNAKLNRIVTVSHMYSRQSMANRKGLFLWKVRYFDRTIFSSRFQNIAWVNASTLASKGDKSVDMIDGYAVKDKTMECSN